VATDSEILDGIENQFLVDGEQLATLRKYAAIARAIETETHKVVPVEPTEAMMDSGYNEIDYDENGQWDNVRNTYLAMLAAAPQFQEEGNA